VSSGPAHPTGPPTAPSSSPAASDPASHTASHQSAQPSGPSHAPRSGAHRPRRPVWHDVLPIAVVALAVIALVIGIFMLKDSVLGGTSTATTSVPGDDDTGPIAPTAPTATSGTTRATTSPSTSATSGPSPSSAVVSHSTRISVYNATSRSGLAKGATGKLTSAGWTHASTGGNKSGVSSTTVFYPTAALRATAKAVAKDLGGYAVQQSTAYGSSGLTVVLGGDYQA
jgi:hypothetical protein